MTPRNFPIRNRTMALLCDAESEAFAGVRRLRDAIKVAVKGGRRPAQRTLDRSRSNIMEDAVRLPKAARTAWTTRTLRPPEDRA